jgi:hypothetical protein
MSIKSFTPIFLCAGMLGIAVAAFSCSQNGNTKADLVISKLSADTDCNDSILAIRNIELSQRDKDSIIIMLSDSTIELKALAISTILSSDELAKYVIEHPSRELIDEVRNRLYYIDGTDAVSKFASALDATFKSLSPAQQAQFLTKVATPIECATHLENSDKDLKAEIEKIYAQSDDKSALTQFEQSLKQHN